ncbi:MAG TPA: ABC transporter ATP-binding protein [Streptosporangiaceae bacterium]|nr:ABC transporter ATP-binding protein [Streptosporangiaceae bacterium]
MASTAVHPANPNDPAGDGSAADDTAATLTRRSGTGQLSLIALTKHFGSVVAVDNINLEIPAGGFFSLLGPSGCGKTTTLRMIAGFEVPSSGQVLLDGQDIAKTPASKRPVNTVFQSYALFPHLRVFDNVAFGLRRARVAKAEVKRRVNEVLELVQLAEYATRKPGQLSGGQQQRVALARALVLQPAVLLLDEPLGALDAKLRRQLQVELKQLQHQVGITFVYVTHDQEEALTMSDRIAVVNRGRIEQAASPQDLYEEPANAFVADFLGVSNLMDATVAGPSAGGLGAEVRLSDNFSVEVRGGDISHRGPAKVVIRPERIGVEAAGTPGPNRLPGMLTNVVYLGSGLQLAIQLASGHGVTALVPNNGEETASAWTPGMAVGCHLPPSGLRVLAASGASAAEEASGG